MDRILEGLTDVRRHNILNSLLALTSVFLLGLATVISESTLVWYLSVLISMTFGFAHTFHSFFTSDAVRQQGDHMPCLVHHAPTHHPTQLGSILGELIVLHLDPDLHLDWRTLNEFRASILPGYDKDQSWERVLYILHLHAKGDLSDSIAMGELSEFIRPDAIREIFLTTMRSSTGALFNACWPTHGCGNRVRSDCLSVCNLTCSQVHRTCCALLGEWTWRSTRNAMREQGTSSSPSTIRPLNRPLQGSKLSAPAVNLAATTGSNSACPPPRKAVSLNAEGRTMPSTGCHATFSKASCCGWASVARARSVDRHGRSSFAMRKVSSSNPCSANHCKASLWLPSSKQKPTFGAGAFVGKSSTSESLNGTQSTECWPCCADGGSAPYGSPPLRRERGSLRMEAWDVIVLGDGPAALHAAAEAAKSGEHFDDVFNRFGHSWDGDVGGLSAPLQEANNRSHREDTIRCGAFLCDQDVVAETTAGAIKHVDLLERRGVNFRRASAGPSIVRKGAGHQQPRTTDAGSATALAIQQVGEEQCMRHGVIRRDRPHPRPHQAIGRGFGRT